MWDLVPWPGIEPRPPALGVCSLNHCATREVLGSPLLFSLFIRKVSFLFLLQHYHSYIFPNPKCNNTISLLEIRGSPFVFMKPQHFSMTYKSPQDPSNLNSVMSCCSTGVPNQPYLQSLLRELFKSIDFQAPAQRCWFNWGERGLRKSVFLRSSLGTSNQPSLRTQDPEHGVSYGSMSFHMRLLLLENGFSTLPFFLPWVFLYFLKCHLLQEAAFNSLRQCKPSSSLIFLLICEQLEGRDWPLSLHPSMVPEIEQELAGPSQGQIPLCPSPLVYRKALAS